MHSVPGLTSPIVQRFLNNVCSKKSTYLEVGSYLGATACAALSNNKLEAYFIDTWEDKVQAMRDDIVLPENNKATFIENIKKFKGQNNISIFHCDMYEVDLEEIKPVEVFFYDGPHDSYNTSKAIQYFSKVFAEECIVIIDDANFDGVVSGAKHGLSKIPYNIIYQKIILNDVESEKEWWNGLYVAVVKKL